MEEKQKLNNILLNEDASSNSTKKYLLIGAALILVFLIILAIMRAVNSGGSNEQVLPPEPAVIPQKNKSLFEKVDVKEQKDSDKEFEKIINDIKEKSGSQTQSEDEEVVDVPETTAPKPPVVSAKPTQTPKPAKNTKPVQAKKPAKAKAAKPKPTNHNKSNSKHSSIRGLYIQVGAFAKLKPDQALIKKLNNNAYRYIYYSTKINGKKLKKLLIGPYKSRSDAKRAIVRIKSLIAKGAFILRVN